jgi:hypothetical protein
MKPHWLFWVAFSLMAADVWEKKAFTEWTPKDVDHVMTASPWARETAASFSGGGGGGMGGGGRGGGGRGGGGMRGGGAPSIDAGEGGGGPGGGPGGGGGGMGGMGGGGGMGGAPQTLVVVRWQSALPVKQALVRARFGAEAGTAADAKTILANEEAYYVIAVDKLPRMGGGRQGGEGKGVADPERMRQIMARSTSLIRKGKEPLKPEDIKMATGEKTMTVYFIFPKSEAITLEDKDVEFVTRFGPLEIKRKFKLQDMVFAGKLEL